MRMRWSGVAKSKTPRFETTARISWKRPASPSAAARSYPTPETTSVTMNGHEGRDTFYVGVLLNDGLFLSNHNLNEIAGSDAVGRLEINGFDDETPSLRIWVCRV